MQFKASKNQEQHARVTYYNFARHLLGVNFYETVVRNADSYGTSF